MVSDCGYLRLVMLCAVMSFHVMSFDELKSVARSSARLKSFEELLRFFANNWRCS